MKNQFSPIEINTLLETFFIEMMDETYEGGLLNTLLNSKEQQERFTRVKIQERFAEVLQYTPFEISYAPSITNLFRSDDITAEQRDIMLKETFDKPYRSMIIKKFNDMIGLDLESFSINETYIYDTNNLHKDSAPTAVILLSVENMLLNYARVYSLRTDSIFDVNLTSLIPFDIDTYSVKFRDWNIRYHKDVLESLGEVA